MREEEEAHRGGNYTQIFSVLSECLYALGHWWFFIQFLFFNVFSLLPLQGNLFFVFVFVFMSGHRWHGEGSGSKCWSRERREREIVCLVRAGVLGYTMEWNTWSQTEWRHQRPVRGPVKASTLSKVTNI